MSQLFLIDSSQRASGDMSDFSINIGPPPDLPNDVDLRIANLTLPQSWYNVREDTTFYWNDGAAQSVVIPAGDYSSVEFGNTFNILTSLAIDFSDLTHKVTISDASAFSIQWSKQDNIASLLGFKTIDSGLSTSHEGDNQFNLSPDLNILIDLGVHRCHNVKNIGCTFCCPVFGNGGTFTDGVGYGKVTVPSNIFKRTMHVRILDIKGRLLPLKTDWSLTLIVE